MTDTELRWHDLNTEPPPLGRPVILFPLISDVGHKYEVARWGYTVSNPEYARLRALEQGYTSWFPVPAHKDEAAVEARCEAFRQSEADAQKQFYDGFKRAAENIVDALKELVPDRPTVALAIEARFVDKT